MGRLTREEVTFRNKLTEKELEFLEEFDKLYSVSKHYTSEYFSEEVIKSARILRSRYRRDIYKPFYNVDVNIANDDLLEDIVYTSQLNNDSLKYTAFDYVRNPYVISEDVLVRMIDQDKQKTLQKNKKELKLVRDDADRDEYKMLVSSLKDMYTGSKLDKKINKLKRRYNID